MLRDPDNRHTWPDQWHGDEEDGKWREIHAYSAGDFRSCAHCGHLLLLHRIGDDACPIIDGESLEFRETSFSPVEDGKAKAREAEPEFRDGDLILYVFDKRANDKRDDFINIFDEWVHTEYASRRYFRGCIRLMTAAEVERKKQEARAAWNRRKEA